MIDRPFLTHAEILSIRRGDLVKYDGRWLTVTKVWHATCCSGNPIAKITAVDDSGLVTWTDTVFQGWYRDRVSFTEAGMEACHKAAAEHVARLAEEIERVVALNAEGN